MAAIRRLLDNAVAHERVPDDVAPALTVAAWAGCGLLALEGAIVWFHHSTGALPSWPFVAWAFDGLGHPGLVLLGIAVVLVAALGLASTTHGFRRASAHGQAAQLALLGLGGVAAVPLLWTFTVGLLIVALVCTGVVLIGWLVLALLG